MQNFPGSPICAVETLQCMLVVGYFSQFPLSYEVVSTINQPLRLVIMFAVLFGGDYIFFCGQIHRLCYCMDSCAHTLDNQVTSPKLFLDEL